MMKDNIARPFLFLLFIFMTTFIPTICTATQYGITVSGVTKSSEPAHAHGYQLMLDYDPQRFQWRKFNVYFDGGFSHFWLNQGPHRTISIYSAAPVVRYIFKKRFFLHPYLELSVGLAYLTQTYLENRNLGIHFSFQDRMGVGVLLGSAERLSFSLHSVHYSNAHIAKNNNGITFPIVLDVGYRFN